MFNFLPFSEFELELARIRRLSMVIWLIYPWATKVYGVPWNTNGFVEEEEEEKKIMEKSKQVISPTGYIGANDVREGFSDTIWQAKSISKASTGPTRVLYTHLSWLSHLYGVPDTK